MSNPASVFDRLLSAFLDVADHEEAIVERIRTAAAMIERADECAAQVANDGLLIRGSAGQYVQHPLIAEERQLRAAADKIWAEVLPADDEPTAPKSTHAQRAAYARWRGNRAG